jgi:hypothetical protein
MEKTGHRPHWIVKQLVPAPADCYAVFGGYQEEGSTPTIRYRVPAFALCEECGKQWEGENDEGPCESNGCQQIRPLVRGNYDHYVPLPVAEESLSSDYMFLGLEYSGSREEEEDWRSEAADRKREWESLKARELKRVGAFSALAAMGKLDKKT